MVTEIGSRHPQNAIDAASPHEILVADRTVQHTISDPLTVTTPGLQLFGCNLRLANEANENLVEIAADGVELMRFSLDGNRSNQSEDRQSNGVVVTGASNVTITNGVIEDVSRHGIRVVDLSTPTAHIMGNDTAVGREGGVSDVTVRDIRIEAPYRDGCSIEGPDVSRVTVENVRTFDSTSRGSVEVKDGASDASVRGCHAANCRYCVALQDHGTYGASNVRFIGNGAMDCETLVDAQTERPPDNVLVAGNVGRDLGGHGMGGPGGIHLHRIQGLVVANNLLDTVDDTGICIRRCTGVNVARNAVRETAGPGISVRDSSRVGVSDNYVEGPDSCAIECEAQEDPMSELHVVDNRCLDSPEGIALRGRVDSYLVATNLSHGSIVDTAEGSGIVTNNFTKEVTGNRSHQA